MPAVRATSSRRRKSSLGMLYSQPKAILGRPVTFAPNVTPISYTVPDDDDDDEPASPKAALFPPSEIPAPPPTRRRVPPGKRRSLGYIPRPPNAFMLFRADFVRQKHVPGSIETNHGSLSKIIGNCWRALPLEEKKVWEIKAKHAKAEHKAQYPEYRFRPVHNKNKDKKKEKPAITAEEERRCEDVAQLLLQGKKGDELAAAVRALDRTATPAAPYPPRRSSSAPLPDYYPQGGIALPSVPFLPSTRPASPARMMLGSRRASSAGARPIGSFSRSWTMPQLPYLQRNESPLPDVDTSIFEQSFLDPAGTNCFTTSANTLFSNDVLNHQQLVIHHNELASLGPFDVSVSPHEMMSASYASPATTNWVDSASPYETPSQYESHPGSHASSAYSGSPAPTPEEIHLPLPMQHLSLESPMQILSPQPIVHPDTHSETVFTDLWSGLTSGRSFDLAADEVYETAKNSPQEHDSYMHAPAYPTQFDDILRMH